MNSINWDMRFMRLARHIAEWSKDPSSGVGCVIVDNLKRVVSTGFNGFPRGVADDGRLQNRPAKLELIVHAEMNALLSAPREVRGCTLYVWPLPTCSGCAKHIVQAGVGRVVFPPPSGGASRWATSTVLAKQMFEEAGILYEEVNIDDY